MREGAVKTPPVLRMPAMDLAISEITNTLFNFSSYKKRLVMDEQGHFMQAFVLKAAITSLVKTTCSSPFVDWRRLEGSLE